MSQRSLDIVVSTGEKLSCRFMTALLQDRGVKAKFVDLSEIITFQARDHVDQVFYATLSNALRATLTLPASQPFVPVITGFFGPVPGGLLSQVGRGYTDLCAALVAVALSASELQIWKEVDGIFTADPRKVPTARLLSDITPAEAAELTFYGSEVIHPHTMEQVIRARIPICIKNVFKPEGFGTRIVPDVLLNEAPELPPRQEAKKKPIAVTVKQNILVLNVHSNLFSIWRDRGFLERVFGILNKHNLPNVDMVSTSQQEVSMALHSAGRLTDNNNKIISPNLAAAVKDLEEFGSVTHKDKMAILCLVGTHMKSQVGVSGRMYYVLGEHGVNIEMISQGASEINISCVIGERDANRAMNILHTHLFTYYE